MIRRVVVSKKEVSIAIERDRLAASLGIDDQTWKPNEADETRPLEIVVPAQTLRRGKQVRLVVGEVNTTARQVDSALLKLVSDAYRWFDDLRTGRTGTIAEIAKREQVQVSHVSRTLPLAFLAPDIVEMIVAGRQPLTLAVERLKEQRKPLLMDWLEQRTSLLSA